MSRTILKIALFIACVLPTATAQSGTMQPFPLEHFNEATGMCRAKGRLQDTEYCRSTTMDLIRSKGVAAIPILISQLTDTRNIQRPIFDYWASMTVGDVAYFVLTDLFTDADGETSTMPDMHSLLANCSDAAQTCWQKVLKRHSRRSIQQAWEKAWAANGKYIVWDPKAECFRVSTTSHS